MGWKKVKSYFVNEWAIFIEIRNVERKCDEFEKFE
jgi:hypothetical protein